MKATTELKLATAVYYTGLLNDSKIALFKGDIETYDKLQAKAKKTKKLIQVNNTNTLTNSGGFFMPKNI